MTGGITNAMRREAQRMIDGKAFSRVGIVTGFDAQRYAAKVLLKPDDVETGWLPVGSTLVGAGWGLLTPPSLGDQVLVHFLDGNLQAGVVGVRFYSAKSAPMGGSKPGEFLLVHASGSRLRFLENGNVELETAQDLAMTVGGDLDVDVDGQVTVQSGQTVSVVAPSGVLVTGNLGVQGTIKATGSITPNMSVP